MEISINNTIKTVTYTTLYDLIISENLESKKGIAIAVNEEIIPKSEWTKTKLFSKDAVLMITATAGG
jgi:sulfur carrier protein